MNSVLTALNQKSTKFTDTLDICPKLFFFNIANNVIFLQKEARHELAVQINKFYME